MKKQLALVAFVAIAIGALARPSWAFQSVKITTVTAGTVTGGVNQANFNLAIRDVANPFGADRSSITWSGVDPLTTQWKVADQLLVINSTVTDVGGGIKIYTDNTASDASPRFVDPTPANAFNSDSLSSGLLFGTSGTTGAPGLPMAWSIKAGPNTPPVAANPNNTGDPNSFQWLFYTDKYNWALGVDLNNSGTLEPGEPEPQALDAPFVTMIKTIGIHFGQAPNEFGGAGNVLQSFVYHQANFAGTSVQQAYQTTALRVEAYIQ